MGFFIFKLICWWVVGSCVIGPLLTWNLFRRNRRERDLEEIREYLSASGGGLNVIPAFVPPKNAAFDREPQAGAIFGGLTAVLQEKQAVSFLNVDAAVLDCLNGVGEIK